MRTQALGRRDVRVNPKVHWDRCVEHQVNLQNEYTNVSGVTIQYHHDTIRIAILSRNYIMSYIIEFLSATACICLY